MLRQRGRRRRRGRTRRWQTHGRFPDEIGCVRGQARVCTRNLFVQIHFVHNAALHARSNVSRHEVVDKFVQAGLTAQMFRPGAHTVPRVPPADPHLSPMLIGHEPVVRLFLLSSADVTRDCLPDHRISLRSAERTLFLYFIVRGRKTVSEIENESVRGSKPEGGEGCSEMGHAQLNLVVKLFVGDKSAAYPGCFETFIWRGKYPLSPANAGWGCFDNPTTPVSRLGLPYTAR